MSAGSGHGEEGVGGRGQLACLLVPWMGGGGTAPVQVHRVPSFNDTSAAQRTAPSGGW